MADLQHLQSRERTRRRVASLLFVCASLVGAAAHAQPSPFTPLEPATQESDDAGPADEEPSEPEGNGDDAPRPPAAGAIIDPENPAYGGGAIVDPENPAYGSGAIVDPENPAYGSGAIVDPENPAYGSGAIVDPENPAYGSGAIVDPENPGSGAIVDPGNPSAGAIVDPQNSAPTPTSPRSTTSQAAYGPPVAIFSGEFGSSAATDTRRDDEYEDTVMLQQELEMRVRFRINDRWRAVTEGRLTWQITGSGDTDSPPWVPDADRVEGRLTPELRDFYVSGRAGRWLLRFGNQSVVWGSTDISKPADIINPIDLRRGVTTSREDIRVPIPALDAVHAWEDVTWEFVLVPFFVPHRLDVYGSDGALLGGNVLALPIVPGAEDLRLLDPSLDDLVQPLLLQTELPEETPRNMSAGSRLTLIRGGWDVSLGYFYGFDRTPRIQFHPAAEALLTALAAEGGTFFNGDPLARAEVQDVLTARENGERLFSATYDRLHTVTFDGVTYAGPIGLRFETAINPRRTIYTESLRSIRRASVSSAFGLSYEHSSGDLIGTTEVFHIFFADRSDDDPILYGLDHFVGLAVGGQLGLGYFEAAQGTAWDRFGVQLASIYLPSGRDWIFAPVLSYDPSERLSVSLSATVYTSFGDDVTLGDSLERNDQIQLGIRRSF